MRISRIAGKSKSAALLVALAGFVAASQGCGGSREAKQQEEQAAAGVRVETVRMQNVADEIQAPGAVIAAATAQVAARAMGTVVRVAVREGDMVKRGQLLAQLDERELAARRSAAHAGSAGSVAGVEEATRALEAAQTQAEMAKKTYDRYVFLRQQKSVSQQEFDEAETRQRAAQANLAQTRARLEQAKAGREQAASEAQAAESVASYARITAPFDGRITRRSVEPGTMITPGTPLFTVEGSGTFQLEATLSSEALSAAKGAIRRGTAARVELDALAEKSLAGKVAELEAGADPGSHTVQVRIDLPREEGIQSGLFGRAWFRRGDRRALAAPAGAVVERGQLRGVFVVDSGGLAQWRVITTGQRAGEAMEVLSGLNEGEQIVVNPGAQDLDGKRVAAAAAGEKKR